MSPALSPASAPGPQIESIGSPPRARSCRRSESLPSPGPTRPKSVIRGRVAVTSAAVSPNNWNPPRAASSPNRIVRVSGLRRMAGHYRPRSRPGARRPRRGRPVPRAPDAAPAPLRPQHAPPRWRSIRAAIASSGAPAGTAFPAALQEPRVPRPEGVATMPTMHEVDYQIVGDDMQFVKIELDPKEAVVAEAGSMMYLEDGIQMDTIFGDGSQQQQGGFMGALLGAGKRLL